MPELRDQLSQVPLHITMCFKDLEIAIGTAFTYVHGEELYLVTNWHNITGREPSTRTLKSKDLAIPDRLQIELPLIEESDSENIGVRWYKAELLLYEDESDVPIKPRWYEHPKHGHKVDVVVIPMGKFDGFKECAICPANAPDLGLSAVLLRPSLNVFILGFPKGMMGGARFPIWKRGSIASEPDIDVDELPKILVDTATREGMSGSPVYICEFGYFRSEEKYDDGQYKRCMGEGRRFIGVYSGRVGDDNFQAQLGIVWKGHVIEEIIQASQIGKSSFLISSSS